MLTDGDIAGLLRLPKSGTSAAQRRDSKAAHLEVNLDLLGPAGERFRLLIRRHKTTPEDFTCGVQHILSDGTVLFLKRYNGCTHPHRNHLEKSEFGRDFHVHTLTARYLESPHKAEGYAETTNAYRDLRGAVALCIRECHIVGLTTDELLGEPSPQLSLLDS